MQLKLSVTNRLRDTMDGNHEHVFGPEGGTIGRAAHNDWVLPDPKRYVSSVHASIEARDGGFYLVDTSMNGIFVNGEKTPLGPTAPLKLEPGIRLRMGNYHIAVASAERVLADDQQTLMAGHFVDDKVERVSHEEPSAELLIEDDIADKLDLESLLDDRMLSANRSLIANLNTGTSTSSTPSHEATEPHQRSVEAAPHTATVHRLPGSSIPTTEKNFRALMQGLGVDRSALESRPSEDIAFAVGSALRAAIDALFTARAARAQSRQALGITTTQQDIDDLAINDLNDEIVDLLLGRGQRYPKAADSVQAEFADVAHHHDAMLGAAAAALNSFIDQMEPADLAQRFEAHGAGRGLFSASRKASLWDQFEAFYAVIAEREPDALPEYIKQELGRAYFARLQTLAKGG